MVAFNGIDKVSGVDELRNFIPHIWSTSMYPELRNKLIFANLFSRQFQGDLRGLGDVVYINQLQTPEGQILMDDKEPFATDVIRSKQFEIKVDKRAVAAVEITDLAKLQSPEFEAEVKKNLAYAVSAEVEKIVIGAMIASDGTNGTPDHVISPVTPSDLAPVDVARARTLLTQAKVPEEDRYFISDPAHYGDLIQKTQFSNTQFIPNTQATSSGFLNTPIYGFRVAESNQLPVDTSFAFHPSAIAIVMQQDLRIKISDNHVNKRFGWIISADMVFGLTTMDSQRIIKITG